MNDGDDGDLGVARRRSIAPRGPQDTPEGDAGGHNPVAILLVLTIAVALIAGALLIVRQLRCNPLYANLNWSQVSSCR